MSGWCGDPFRGGYGMWKCLFDRERSNPLAEEYGHAEILAIDGFRGEIVDGMVVYYEDNPCDSDELDWEDPYDVAAWQYVDDYNFDVPDGMDLMVYERGGGGGGGASIRNDCGCGDETTGG